MTDANTQTGPKAPPPPAKAGRWVKILLAVSLALNLAVVGVVAGAALKARNFDGGRPPDIRELNFGPFTGALSRPQRRALLQGFVADQPPLREMRSLIRAEYQLVLDAVRAQPFDPIALQAALAGQSRSTIARLDAGRKALEGVIIAMSPEDRAAYADRLEDGLQRRRSDARDPANPRERLNDGGRRP
jgi:uncharacterized membrane protein